MLKNDYDEDVIYRITIEINFVLSYERKQRYTELISNPILTWVAHAFSR